MRHPITAVRISANSAAREEGKQKASDKTNFQMNLRKRNRPGGRTGLRQEHIDLMPREWCIRGTKVRSKVREQIDQDEVRWNSLSNISSCPFARELVLRHLDAVLRVLGRWWGLNEGFREGRLRRQTGVSPLSGR